MKAVELRARLDRLRGTRMYTLSKDYGKLFDYLCAGNVAVGWVDCSNVRDVVKIQRRKAFDVYIGVRGVCYTDLGAHDQEKGEERDVFAMRCAAVGLEWIEPAMPRVTAALVELRLDKDQLAFTLFRRAQIDQVEMRRMGNRTTFYDPDREKLTEQGIKTSWYADSKTRAYWYALAAEAIRFADNEELTHLPQSLTCLQCRGTGRLFVVTEEGLEPRTAKAQGKLELQACNACGGTGDAQQ